MQIFFTTTLSLLISSTLRLYAQPSPAEKPLMIASGDEFFDLHPMSKQWKGKERLLALCQRGLLRVDETGKLKPELLSQLPVVKPNVMIDGEYRTVMDIDLNPKAAFGDGAPVTSQDLRFSWTVGKSQGLQPYSMIEDVWVWETRPERIRFLLAREATANVLQQLGDFKVIRAKKEAVMYGKDYWTKTQYRTLPTLPDLYNGPYTVTEYEPGRHILFSRNPSFVGKSAEIAEIKVILEPDPNQVEKMLAGGDFQIAFADMFSQAQLHTFEEKVLKDSLPFKVQKKPSLVQDRIDFNHRHPLLGDVRVRRALALAVDRGSLHDELLPERKFLANSFRENSWREILPYALRLEKASGLMKTLGWLKGKDGTLARKGKRLSLPLAVDAHDPFRNKLAELLKNQWAKLGVDIQIKNLGAGEFVDLIRKAEFSSMALYAQRSPKQLSRQFGSAYIPNKANAFFGENYGRFVHKGFEQTLLQHEQEWNFTRRETLLDELEEKFQETVPFLPLFFRTESVILSKELSRVFLPHSSIQMTSFVENWVREQ